MPRPEHNFDNQYGQGDADMMFQNNYDYDPRSQGAPSNFQQLDGGTGQFKQAQFDNESYGSYD